MAITFGPLADALSGASILSASIYGFGLLNKPSSGPRTLVKAAGVACIGAVSIAMGGPWLLTLPLFFSAAGDAFMAGEPKRWLPFGLGCFLVAHLIYIALFSHQGLGLAPLFQDPLRLAPAIVVLLAGALMLRYIWPGLGRMREAVVLYVAVITVMTLMAFTLPWSRSAAMIGALLFMTSDGILAVRLFRAGGANLTADLAVWWFYWAAQALIARAFLHTA